MKNIKAPLLAVLAIVINSCGEQAVQTPPSAIDSAQRPGADPVAVDTNDIAADSDTLDYANFYILILDTGDNYYRLDSKMYALSKTLSLPIDTANRHYDAEKQDIVLSENDEDEMYRGEYFPRRFPSIALSLEHLNVYKENANDKSLALLSGIFDNKPAADSALLAVKAFVPGTFLLRSKVYVGCMH